MNKAAVYITLLFAGLCVFSLIGGYITNHPNILFVAQQLQFYEIGKSEVAETHGRNPGTIFIANEPESGQKQLYFSRWVDDTSIEGVWNVKHIDSTHQDSSEIYLMQSFVEEGLVEEKPVQLSQEAIVELLAKSKDFAAVRLYQYTTEAGFWGFLDDSVFIFLFIAILMFLAIWLLESFGNVLNRYIHPRSKLILYTLCVLGVFTFISLVKISTWLPVSMTAMMVRNGIVLFLGFAGFQSVVRKSLSKFDVPDQELVKFFMLSMGFITLFFMGNIVGLVIDEASFEYVIDRHIGASAHVTIGLMVAFALANLMNNLRKYLLQARADSKLLKTTQKQHLASTSELAALQSSINPHFLYNSLNSIASLARDNPEKTEQMALSLSVFYQYVTNREVQHESTLADEIEMLQNYLNIEKIRFEDRLKVEIDCADAAMTCYLPRFSLQPLVENAIKYGFKEEQVEVHISAVYENKDLQIRIYDSGKAFDEQLSQGYGLKNVAQKLRLLYPERHELAFINQPKKHVFISIKQAI